MQTYEKVYFIDLLNKPYLGKDVRERLLIIGLTVFFSVGLAMMLHIVVLIIFLLINLVFNVEELIVFQFLSNYRVDTVILLTFPCAYILFKEIIKNIEAKLYVFNQKVKLSLAAQNGNCETIKQILEEGYDIWNILNGFTHEEIQEFGPCEKIELVEGKTPLMYAAENNQLKSLKTLLKEGSDVNYRDCYGETALDYAKWKKHKQIINELIKHGAKD